MHLIIKKKKIKSYLKLLCNRKLTELAIIIKKRKKRKKKKEREMLTKNKLVICILKIKRNEF